MLLTELCYWQVVSSYVGSLCQVSEYWNKLNLVTFISNEVNASAIDSTNALGVHVSMATLKT